MAVIVGGIAIAGVFMNPKDSYRLVRTVPYFGKNVVDAFKNLGLTFVECDVSYLGSSVWRLLDAAGNIVDVPVYGVAVAVSWIPLVRSLPFGWSWAKLRGQE